MCLTCRAAICPGKQEKFLEQRMRDCILSTISIPILMLRGRVVWPQLCPHAWVLSVLQMSWYPQYRSSKFRHVYGKAANKENCYDCVPITRSVHDNHFCAVNPHFVAVVTECAGGGAFLVIPVNQVSTPKVYHLYVCGREGWGVTSPFRP